MPDPNRFQGKCIRCGKHVGPWEGYHSFGSGSDPYPWPQHRFQRNLNIVEHRDCHAIWKGTSRHYLFDPKGTETR